MTEEERDAFGEEDLEWADIPHSASAPAAPVREPARRSGRSRDSEGAVAPPPLFGCLSVSFYQRWFDIDTPDVTQRLFLALFPFRVARAPPQAVPISSEVEEEGEEGSGGVVDVSNPFVSKPDLYGPLWIAATAVFALAVASNAAGWLTFTPDVEDSIWKYDFRTLTTASFVLFGALVFVPLGAWIWLRYAAGVVVELGVLACVFGYSLVSFLPAILLCAIPYFILQWILCLAASINAAYFCIKSLLPALKQAAYDAGREPLSDDEEDVQQNNRQSTILARLVGGDAASRPVLVAIGLVHIALGISIKIAFF